MLKNLFGMKNTAGSEPPLKPGERIWIMSANAWGASVWEAEVVECLKDYFTFFIPGHHEERRYMSYIEDGWFPGRLQAILAMRLALDKEIEAKKAYLAQYMANYEQFMREAEHIMNEAENIQDNIIGTSRNTKHIV